MKTKYKMLILFGICLALCASFSLVRSFQTPVKATTATLWELLSDYGWTRSRQHVVAFSGYFPGSATLTFTLEDEWNAVPESVQCWYETASGVFAFVGAYTPSDADVDGILDTVEVTCTSGDTAGGIYRLLVTTYDGI